MSFKKDLIDLVTSILAKMDAYLSCCGELKTLILAIPTTPELEAAAAARFTVLAGYVDEVESLLKNAAYGLSALQTLIAAIPTTPELEANALARYNTIVGYVDEVESLLKNVTYGLAALKAWMDARPAERGTDNAMLAVNGALEASLTAIKGAGWTNETLVAIKALVAAIPTTPELEADALTRYTTLTAYVDEVEGLLKNVTYGLSALKTAINAIPTTPELEADALARYNALEATLAAIKGAGWTNETLVAIKALVAAIPTTPELEATALARFTVLAAYVDELETRLTATRALLLDNLDAAISSRLAAASYVTERGTDNAMLAVNGALEATLTAIKGAGWSTQTLVAIMTAISAISGGATAQQVWEYATRILTNLSDVRAAKIDNLDATISSRLAAASYTAERGTDNAALASVCTEARLARLDAAITTRVAFSNYDYSNSLAAQAYYYPPAKTIFGWAASGYGSAAVQLLVWYSPGSGDVAELTATESVKTKIQSTAQMMCLHNDATSARTITLYGATWS